MPVPAKGGGGGGVQECRGSPLRMTAGLQGDGAPGVRQVSRTAPVIYRFCWGVRLREVSTHLCPRQGPRSSAPPTQPTWRMASLGPAAHLGLIEFRGPERNRLDLPTGKGQRSPGRLRRPPPAVHPPLPPSSPPSSRSLLAAPPSPAPLCPAGSSLGRRPRSPPRTTLAATCRAAFENSLHDLNVICQNNTTCPVLRFCPHQF